MQAAIPPFPLATTTTTTTAVQLLDLSTGGLNTPPNSNPHNKPGCDEQLPMRIEASDDIAMARRAARTYRSGPQLIMPYLYLGGAGNVADSQLQALEITHVLNVAREVEGVQPVVAVGAAAYRHCMWDHDEPDLARYFGDCFAFIDSARTAQQGILVHCQLGVSRSASLIIAYVMRTMALGFGAAYEYVRLRAPCISPNLSLIAQLCEYGEMLAHQRRTLATPTAAAAAAAAAVAAAPPSSSSSSSSSSALPGLCALFLPELSADESSSAGSENSSPMEVQDDGGVDASSSSVDLLTMPIKQLPLPLPLLVLSKPPMPEAASHQGPHLLRVIASRHPLVP